jgi:hypothetical protein
MSANIIPFAPQRSSEDCEAQAAASDMRSQYVIFVSHAFATHRAMVEALEKHEEMMEYFLSIAEQHCPKK